MHSIVILISTLDCHDKHKASYPSDAEIDNVLCEADNQHGLIYVEFQGATSAIHISNKRRNVSVLTSKKRLQISGKYLHTYLFNNSFCIAIHMYMCIAMCLHI